MSSTLVLSHPFPPFTHSRDRARQEQEQERERERERESDRIGELVRSQSCGRWRAVDATTEHGLRTPPTEMTEMNVNPLLAPNMGGLPYQSIPAATPHHAPFTTSLKTIASTKYTSKAPPIHESYHPPHRPHSPVFQKDGSRSREQQRGRTAGENHYIAEYLQIPSTINDSKGSLADFAAQITCLFWFESSYILHHVEESKMTPTPTSPLVSEAMPTLGFRKWVTTILSTTQVTQNVILLALMFIYRLKRLNPGVKGKLGSEFRLLTVALMLGNKFLDDNTYTNKTWAEVSGISVQEIHIMEVEFLSNMRYTLYASEAVWQEWHVKLGKFWNYFNLASKTPLGGTPKPISLPAPNPHQYPELPSPPASTQTSPPFTTQYSLNPQSYSHPLSAPHYRPPTLPSPVTHLPEIDLRSCGRKRSYDDPHPELSSKRVSLTPGTYSSTSSASTLKENISPAPRLPMPNLSISTGGPHGGQHQSSPAYLPMPPHRSMITVFPGPSRWPQNGILPSLQPSGHLSGTHSHSPMNEWPGRRSPYPPGSATPSPTSHSFQQPQQTPGHLSPSGYPTSRSSPYKPVRSVNTLLVPPPSASMHNPPQHLNLDQMHYQPLGKPMSERRTGVLPYMHHDSWSMPFENFHVLPHLKYA